MKKIFEFSKEVHVESEDFCGGDYGFIFYQKGMQMRMVVKCRYTPYKYLGNLIGLNTKLQRREYEWQTKLAKVDFIQDDKKYYMRIRHKSLKKPIKVLVNKSVVEETLRKAHSFGLVKK